MAKKSTKSNEKSESKSDAKQKSSTKSAAAKTKQPLISTGKKIGIAMYFTFLATLACVIGVQMLLTQNIDTPTPAADTYSTNIVETTQPSTDPIDTLSHASNYSDFPIDEKAPRHNVATPFDGTPSATSSDAAMLPQNATQSADDTSKSLPSTTCPDGNCTLSTDPACPDGNCDTLANPACPDGNCELSSSPTCPDENCNKLVNPSCPDGNCDLATKTACPDGNCAE